MDSTAMIAVLAMAPLVLIPLAWQTLGSILGWYLLRKTEGRRAHIIELVEKEEARYQEESAQRTEKEDQDWERIDRHAAGTSQNGEKGDKEWDGIVGFFHPFW